MSRITRFSRWTMALLVALVALGTTFGSASAASANVGDRPNKPDKANIALSRRYKVEQKRLQLQEVRLTRAKEHAAKIDALIAKLKAKGKDTAELEKAVAAYRAGIEKARAEWQVASDTLKAHAGFDADGKVTNADQARATLKDAHGHMEQTHTLARDAYKGLHAAIAAYRKAHRDVSAPPAPPSP